MVLPLIGAYKFNNLCKNEKIREYVKKHAVFFIKDVMKNTKLRDMELLEDMLFTLGFGKFVIEKKEKGFIVLGESNIAKQYLIKNKKREKMDALISSMLEGLFSFLYKTNYI